MTPLHVTLVATPDTQVSPLSGLYETLEAFPLLASIENDVPTRPFHVDIVVPNDGVKRGASGLPLGAHLTHDDVEQTDIAIVPLMMVSDLHWETGRYPRLVRWLERQHAGGAVLASACTGVLLVAETGLLEGREATLHWAFARTFRENFPGVRLRTEEVLITCGPRGELVMTGGVMSWHDLALHLIARHVGPIAAQSMARLLMLEWHGKGQAPYVHFSPRLDHGDAAVADAQRWLALHYMSDNPVEEVCARTKLSRRTLERRFRAVTGHTPIAYVQELRIEEARRLLERTTHSVEQIGAEVGYENGGFFRRVFRRVTHLTPSAYRRKFQLRGLGA
ncbi:MAG: helix-turn-helix domain-containing protein [Polyangiaceae bacterium]|nr:helix-turn-helix domain-containing protein [Polyangiaceae bacterium]